MDQAARANTTNTVAATATLRRAASPMGHFSLASALTGPFLLIVASVMSIIVASPLSGLRVHGLLVF